MIYSGSNLYLSIGDRLPALMADINLKNGIHKEASSHFGNSSLAMVTFFQYLEKLSDRQAAEATSRRVDWKYALHLSMNYPGLDPASLCEFRQSLLCQPERVQEYQRFIDRMVERGYYPESQEQPLEALRIVNEVCARTRLDKVKTGMRHAVQALAIRQPEWLRQISRPYWYIRYEMTNHLSDLNQTTEQQQALTEAIGVDIAYLLNTINQAGKSELASLNEVQELYRVWREQFDPITLEGVKLFPFCYLCGTMHQQKFGNGEASMK
jgi:transposase